MIERPQKADLKDALAQAARGNIIARKGKLGKRCMHFLFICWSEFQRSEQSSAAHGSPRSQLADSEEELINIPYVMNTK